MRRVQGTRTMVTLLAAVWLGVPTSAAQGERDAVIDRLLTRIPPVIGEFEACLDVQPVPGLILVRNIRQIVLSRLFWRMRERDHALDDVDDRLASVGRQTERMRLIAVGHLREISSDPQKIEGHCEHAAMLVRNLLEELR